LKETGKLGCRPASTPLERNWKQKITDDDPPVDRKTYQHLVGKLIYLSLIRPNITFSMSLISQFMHTPTKRHMDVAIQILRYLKGSLGKGLLFRKMSTRDVVGYSNADGVGAVDDSKSTTGYCTKVWENLVT